MTEDNGQKILGLEVSDRSIEACEVYNVKETYSVTACSRIVLPEGIITQGKINDPSKLQEALQELFKNAKPNPFEAQQAVISIPDSSVFTIIKEMPWGTDEQEVIKNVQAEIQKSLSNDVSHTYSYKNILTATKGSRLVHAVTQKENLDMLLMELRFSDLQILGVESESLSIMRASIQKFEEEEGVVFVDLGALNTVITIFDIQRLGYKAVLPFAGNAVTKIIATALNISYDDAEQIKLNHGLEKHQQLEKYKKRVEGLLLKIVEEIRTGIEEYTKKTKRQVKYIKLCGGSSLIKGIDSYFSENLKEYSVQRANTWVDHSNIQSENVVYYLSAIGLALKGFNYNNDLQVGNFLKESDRAKPKKGGSLLTKIKNLFFKRSKKQKPKIAEKPKQDSNSKTQQKAQAEEKPQIKSESPLPEEKEPEVKKQDTTEKSTTVGKLAKVMGIEKVEKPAVPKMQKPVEVRLVDKDQVAELEKDIQEFKHGETEPSQKKPKERPKKVAKKIKKQNKTSTRKWLLLLLGILTVGAVVYVLFFSGIIDLSQETPMPVQSGRSTFSFEETEVLDIKAVETNALPFEVAEKEIVLEETFDATGTQEASGTLSGTVEIINESLVNYEFVATTRLVTEDGRLYRLDEKTLAQSSATTEATATAAGEGALYALEPGTQLTFPGLGEDLQESMYAQVKSGFSAESVTIVSQDDLENAYTAFEQRAEETDETIDISVDNGNIISNTFYDYEIDATTYDTEAGEQKDTFTGQANVTLYFLEFSQEDVEAYMQERFSKHAQEGEGVDDYSLKEFNITIQAYQKENKTVTILINCEAVKE